MNYFSLQLPDIESYDKINPIIETLNEVYKSVIFVKSTLIDIINIKNAYFK